MHWIDWTILLGTLGFITAFGVWKTRSTHTSEGYLRGGGDARWWGVGLSVMATQASAITFLSTPGQGFADGMGFVQFYFGLPLAMVVIGGLVGAGALGYDVVYGLAHAEAAGKGIAAGFSIALLGIMIDRVSRSAAARGGAGSQARERANLIGRVRRYAGAK